MKTHSVVQRISSLDWQNANMGQLPNRVFMAMVNNDARTGSIAKNPFYFKHFSPSQVTICLNEECLPHHSSSMLLIINTYMNTEVYLKPHRK